MTQPRPPRGLTLIELVAAMAIFALVAVMGVQSLSGMMRQRDLLGERSDRARELEIALALLRADLAAGVPLLFYPAGRGAPLSSLAQSRDGFALSIAGQRRLDLGQAPAFHRVEYRLDRGTGRLTRKVWQSLTPANLGSAQPEVPILTGVSGLRLRSYPTHDIGWVDGPAQASYTPSETPSADDDRTFGPPEVYSSTLPLAVEITLVLEDLGSVPVLESFQ